MPIRTKQDIAALKKLAGALGVQTLFVDASGERREASVESLKAIVGALGYPVRSARELPGQLKAVSKDIASRRIEPVIVGWAGRATKVPVRLKDEEAPKRISAEVSLEGGDSRTFKLSADELKIVRKRDADGESRSFAAVTLPRDLPEGYHTLTLTIGRTVHEARLIVAPKVSYRHDAGRCDREWGLFCPIYALRSDRNMGCGDLTDFEEVIRITRERGGRVVATLPLLAAFLDEPFDPSPYSPVSRLFWNELFIDPERVAEFEDCASAKRMVASQSFRRQVESLKTGEIVQYRRAAALKRRVLEALCATFEEGDGFERAEFKAFERARPDLWRYAHFRAALERQKVSWREWPRDVIKNVLKSKKRSDDELAAYHAYAQFCFFRQFEALSADIRASEGLVYLDLPVGVHPDGFDVCSNEKLFALNMSVGAPPDPFFTGGQDWGFPPMHPRELKESGYAHFIDALRNHMRACDVLRLDHVMAFDRLFWIPVGSGADGGVYVEYDGEAFAAILCLESHRNRCRLIGENLGTVPPKVNKRLERHEMGGMYIVQYESQPEAKTALRAVPANAAASVNSHDMPTFRAWIESRDVKDRIDVGMLDPEMERDERGARTRHVEALKRFLRGKKLTPRVQAETGDLLDASLMFMASSEAELLIVNPEDLWGETHWQNIPGTMVQHPNWRHVFRYQIDAIEADPEIGGLFDRIEEQRDSGRSQKRRGSRVMR
ncbi:MAG: 4-alpha-glucanotransferase [Planctomycetota bacterium]